MKKTLLLLMTLFTLNLSGNQILHHTMNEDSYSQNSYIWEQKDLEHFDELIVSWNAHRPENGHYSITLSLFIHTWTPWLDYAFWGIADQYTFHQQDPDGLFRTYQDAAEVLKGEKATGFKICITAKDGASLEHVRSLHACTTNLKRHEVCAGKGIDALIDLKVSGLSQVALPDERNMRLCSPTSTTAVINYLSPTLHVDPLSFADSIIDSAFDIYGNWILNTAQAADFLDGRWSCSVVRLTSFDQILELLQKGTPVVVSIKGPLNGAADSYNEGHLIVVKGYDPKEQKVLCMDPAFPEDNLTLVSYSLEDFLTAWRRRNGIAYVFMKN